MRRVGWILFLVAQLVACSSDAVDVVPDAVETADSAPAEVVEVVILPDAVTEDTGLELPPIGDLVVDFPTLECEPGEGCFGDGCSDNDECDSGWCVQHMGESVCSKHCEAECPAGWTCKQVSATGPDVVYICVSNHANLCRPCSGANDCESTGGAEDACVSYGEGGNFCGGTCQKTGDCPWGFSCQNSLTVEGVEVLQCVNDAGVCPCTEASVASGLSTPCKVENEFGLCDGKRVCTDDGLGDCDAPVPGPEVCNGLDDDCNGEIDEPNLVDGLYVHVCDDSNECTADTCFGEEGCGNEAVAEGECSDGDPCTVADHCEAGACVADALECDDDNPCTDNVCTATGGCDFYANTLSCDDSNACTVADECVDGDCVGVSVSCDCLVDADCETLEDGDLCNGTLFCDTEQFPHQCAVASDSVVECPQPEGLDAFCLQAQCEPATGECLFVPDHEGLVCDNGDACTIGDKCEAGVCAAGAGANCNDGNLCTDDSCDSTAGCLHLDNEAACNDGDVCTTQDQCSAGVCAGGALLVCDDQDACNGLETCDPQVGCLPGEVLVCNDGNACNGVESCDSAAGCVGGGAISCDDDNLCTDDDCDPAEGCIHLPNQNACDDGNACTTGDVCGQGKCGYSGSLECHDGNPCTNDSCDAGAGCVFSVADGECSDGDPCTVGDHCDDGACIPGSVQDCDDGNVCTDDSCDAAGLCLHQPNDETCDDANECTLGDHCSGGLCQAAQLQDCGDGNPCTDDSCSPAAGCVYDVTAGPCSDGDPCTVGDQCELGLCTPGTVQDCDDANPCTDDYCDGDGLCQHDPNQANCDDGNECTEGDHCQGGACLVDALVDCDDGNECTADGCEPADGCWKVDNVAACDDGDLCTAGDQCSEGQCVPGVPVTCDDGNVCTDDSCVPADGCLFESNQAPCDDGESCTANDLCADGVCGGVPCEDAGMYCGALGCEPCGSLEFDGVDDHVVDGPTWGDLSADATDVTFEVWFKMTGDQAAGTGLMNISCGLYALKFAGGNRLQAVRWTGGQCTGSTAVTVGQWHHAAVVADIQAGGEYRLYLDGKEECSATGTKAISEWIDAAVEKLYIGSSTGGGCISEGNPAIPESFYTGRLDAVRVSDIARYDDIFVPSQPEQTDADTVLLYLFDEGAGDSVGDNSDSGLDGTLHGNPAWSSDQPHASCCEPWCVGKVCGDDGCGGSCGECESPAECYHGECVTEIVVLEDQFDDASIDESLWDASCIKWGGPGGCSISESGGTINLNATVSSTGNTYGGTAWARTKLDFKTGDDYRIAFDWSYTRQATSLNCGIIEIADGPVSVNQGGLFDHNIHSETAGRKFLNYQTTNLPAQTWSVCVDGAAETAGIYSNDDCSGDPVKEVDVSALGQWYLRFLVCTATSAGFPANNVTMKLDWLEAFRL